MTPELKHALEVIRDECERHVYCNFCPLSKFMYGRHCCAIGRIVPRDWKVKERESAAKDTKNG